MKIEQKPWQVRLGGAKRKNCEVREIMHQKMNIFLGGVSQLSHPGYADWLLKELDARYEIKADLDLKLVISHLKSLTDTQDYCEDAYEALFWLIIEPFYMLEQMEKESIKNGI